MYGSGSLWVDEFQTVELTEIMRQKDDALFCQLLCRIRTATHTEEDIAMLKSREETPDAPNYPNDALYVYRLNVDVDKHNQEMLNVFALESKQYPIKACNARAGQTSHIDFQPYLIRDQKLVAYTLF